MTMQKVPELSAKLMMARMRRKMMMERWHMGYNRTKQNKTKQKKGTLLQPYSHTSGIKK